MKRKISHDGDADGDIASMLMAIKRILLQIYVCSREEGRLSFEAEKKALAASNISEIFCVFPMTHENGKI